MMSYINAFDVLFKYVNMHWVASSPIVNKVAKLWCFSVSVPTSLWVLLTTDNVGAT